MVVVGYAACFAKLCLTCCVSYTAMLLCNVQHHAFRNIIIEAARCEDLRILELLLALGGDADERDSEVSDYIPNSRSQCASNLTPKQNMLECEAISISESTCCCRDKRLQATRGMMLQRHADACIILCQA